MTKKKHIAILGSTGSIGTQALSVIEANPDLFQVEVLTARNNTALLISQAKQFQPNEDVFNAIQELGQEFGSTTGRKRQCNWLNWDLIKQACKMNSVTNLIINKLDVLQQTEEWAIYYKGGLLNFPDHEPFVEWIQKEIGRAHV